MLEGGYAKVPQSGSPSNGADNRKRKTFRDLIRGARRALRRCAHLSFESAARRDPDMLCWLIVVRCQQIADATLPRVSQTTAECNPWLPASVDFCRSPKCQLSKNAAGVLHHLVEMAGCPAYVTESARFRSGTANATPNHMCVFPQLPSMYNVCHRQTLGMYNVCHRQTLGPSTMSATGRR